MSKTARGKGHGMGRAYTAYKMPWTVAIDGNDRRHVYPDPDLTHCTTLLIQQHPLLPVTRCSSLA